MRRIARTQKGKCLSQKYINNNSKLLWKCKQGHKWKATPKNIKLGQWCPACAIIRISNKKRLTIEEIQSIAKSRSGECLSKEYHGSRIHLLWKCKEGHIWEVDPHHIKQGNWCPTCANNLRKLSINEMQKIAKSRKGKCLSKKYIGVHHNLLWQCKNKHEFRVSPNHIKRGQWCHICAINKKKM